MAAETCYKPDISDSEPIEWELIMVPGSQSFDITVILTIYTTYIYIYFIIYFGISFLLFIDLFSWDSEPLGRTKRMASDLRIASLLLCLFWDDFGIHIYKVSFRFSYPGE